MAVKPCGCHVAAVIDDAELDPDSYHSDRLVAAWMERGLRVERATVGDARQKLHRCTCSTDRKVTEAYRERIAEHRARDIRAALMRDKVPRPTYVEIGAAIGVSKSYARYCVQRGSRLLYAKLEAGIRSQHRSAGVRVDSLQAASTPKGDT